MRPPIERIRDLNELVESVPEEIVRQIQEESQSQPESTSEDANMPTDKKPSKSKRIRDYMAAHPDAAPKDIVAALAQYGVKPTDVGNVRAKMKGPKAVRRTGTSSKPVAPTKASSLSAPSSGINLKALEAGTLFLKEAGSLSNAREILIVIDQIRTA